MNAETIPTKTTEHEPERDREPLPVISYEEYREFCDTAQPDIYRKAGIDGREDYETAQDNPNTVFIEREGQRLPLFVPLENAGGYNVDGTRGLTDRQHVFAMALPLDLLDAEELEVQLEGLGENAAVIVQTSSQHTNTAKESLATLENIGWHVGDFLDPRCPEGRQMASMSFYSVSFEALDESGEVLSVRNLSYKELYEEDALESGRSDTVLMTAQELRDNKELREQLWELHDDRFGWLGRHHPVSMQETKDFFEEVVVDNDRAISLIRYDTDENGNRIPVCHCCFVDDLSMVDWVNDRFRQEMVDEAAENGEKPQFLFGIVSSSQNSAHYAEDVIKLYARIGKLNGGKHRLLFESTNMSSLYIPKMIQKYTAEEPNGVKMIESVKHAAQLDYWYLASEPRETV